MKEYACPKDQFLRDVGGHSMTVIRDNGVERHLHFRKPGTYCYGFDLLTFGGHLLITGDCGSYLFRRLDDMFEFFRSDRKPADELHIEPQYWAEKLQATDCSGSRGGAAKEFSKEKFEASIKRWFDDHFEDEIREDVERAADADNQEPELIAERKRIRDGIWSQISSRVLNCSDNEHDALEAAMNFECHGFRFQDFFEVDNRDYTFHFIWCAYAIAWGIKQYDALKAGATVSEVST